MRGIAKKLQPTNIDERILDILKQISTSTTEQAHYIERSRIILTSLEEKTASQVAAEVGVHRNTASKWRKRFVDNLDYLNNCAKTLKKAKLKREIKKILSDAPRSGAPRKYNKDQRAGIISIACSDPKDYGLPDSHMVLTTILQKAVEEEIVGPEISKATVFRILDEVDLKPHKTKGWLNRSARAKDPLDYDQRIKNVNETYEMAKTCSENVHICSVDEKTGISARERSHPDLPVQKGHCAKLEHGYLRHGSSVLNAVFEVATGEIIHHSHTQTHREEDFFALIEATVDLNPEDSWIFVLDNYSTHLSESLVRFVNRRCQLGLTEEELGQKRKNGILFDMKSRRAFLEDKSHRIRFVYTPPHASWMNQVEIWFSSLARRLTNRGSFQSIEELTSRIDDFIKNYNQFAHPYQWTFSGKLLVA